MKRIIFWVLMAGFVSQNNVVQAAQGMQLKNVALSWESSEEQGTTTEFTSKTKGEWNWLWLDFSNKFIIQSAKERYSYLDATLVLPKLTENLKGDFNYQWNKDYYILVGGVNYKRRLFDGWTLKINSDYGLREAFNSEKSKYHYKQDSQGLNLSYQNDYWGYGFDLSRAIKDYPVTTYYSSEKLQLDQELNWFIKPNLKTGLIFQESNGYYPFDKSLTRDYWKEKWSIWGEYKLKKQWKLALKSTNLKWDQGRLYKPYRKDWRTEMKFTKLYPNSELALQTSYADLQYESSQQFDEPGDVIIEEEDTKSRVEQKVSLEYLYNFEKSVLGLGYFSGDYNYKYSEELNTRKAGFYATTTWQLSKFVLKVKAAPEGDLQRRNGYYELKLEYKP